MSQLTHRITVSPATPTGGGKDVQDRRPRMHLSQERHVTDEAGQAVVEYGILLALISVAAIAFLPGVGDAVSTLYQTASDAITTALS